MQIFNYYRGATDKLSGFLFDTDTKKYKEVTVKNTEWSHEYKHKGATLVAPIEGFTAPGDIAYFFNTKSNLDAQLDKIRKLGFTEDKNIVVDFGIFIK